MTAWDVSVSLRTKAKLPDTVSGNAYPPPAKGLTLTERRLSFTFAEGTPRPEGQALRRPRGGPMEAALILRFLLIKEKEGKECSPLAV